MADAVNTASTQKIEREMAKACSLSGRCEVFLEDSELKTVDQHRISDLASGFCWDSGRIDMDTGPCTHGHA